MVIHIPMFVCGIIATLLVEFTLAIIASEVKHYKKSKENKNGEHKESN